MLRTTATSLLRTMAPRTRNLLLSSRAPFATDPFNNPYGDKAKNMQNVNHEIKTG